MLAAGQLRWTGKREGGRVRWRKTFFRFKWPPTSPNFPKCQVPFPQERRRVERLSGEILLGGKSDLHLSGGARAYL
jgi:hypothetical protein